MPTVPIRSYMWSFLDQSLLLINSQLVLSRGRDELGVEDRSLNFTETTTLLRQ